MHVLVYCDLNEVLLQQCGTVFSWRPLFATQNPDVSSSLSSVASCSALIYKTWRQVDFVLAEIVLWDRALA